MRTLRFISARALYLAYFFYLSGAVAQDEPLPAPMSWSTELRGVDLQGLSTITRTSEQTFPVSDASKLFVSNRYGDIHVTAWDNSVISISAVITVGAEDSERARDFANALRVDGNQLDNGVEIRTVFPDTMENEQIGYSVDYRISVPVDAEVVLENFFGDSFVRGTEGDATVDSRYGVVELRDMGGLVRVRAKGEFPLVADNLRKGGTFFMRSTHAVFSNVSGTLNVNNYLGSVELRSPGDVVDMDVRAESGPIHLFMPEDARVDLDAVADYGTIESNMLLEREVWGKTVHARQREEESRQRIALHSSFSTIVITREGLEAKAEPLFDENSKPIERVITQSYPAPEGTRLELKAMTGDLRIEGVEEARIGIIATQSVRVHKLENAQLALEGLGLRVTFEDGVLHVRTVVQEDMEALGCSSYRVDISVSVPLGTPVHVVAENGDTEVGGTRGPVTVEQAAGTIRVANTTGDLRLSLQSGDIEANNCSGTLNASTENGSVSVRNVAGNTEIDVRQGKTVIDAPGAEVAVRSVGGDIIVLALQGIYGNFDISAEDGDISVAVPSTADATFWLRAQGGTIRSAVPVSGTMDKAVHSFQGLLNEGTYNVTLKTRQGDIVLD